MADTNSESQITPLLIRWREGDRDALDELFPLVYHELSLIARKRLRGERFDHSYSTGDLLHEAYIRLFGDQNKVEWENKIHFFALAGRVMRNILINHANEKKTKKRGGADFERVNLDIHKLPGCSSRVISDLDEAVAHLEQKEKNTFLAVELYYFCGFTIQEVAEELKISPATTKRKLKLAQQWLDRYLNQSR